MEQLDIFGTKAYEYLIVIEPDKKTIEKLIVFRKLLNAMTTLSKEFLQSKPHISLCYFEATDFSEELIISKIKQAISSIKSFDIALNGCEKWKNGTFILKINPDQNLYQLQEEFSKVFKGVIKTPHLTIARNLPEEFLNNLLPDEFQYYGNFTCETITLLRRSQNAPYQILDKIPLLQE